VIPRDRRNVFVFSFRRFLLSRLVATVFVIALRAGSERAHFRGELQNDTFESRDLFFRGAVVNAHPARAFNTDLVPHQRRFAERRHGSRSFARKHVSERGAAETAPARAAVRRQDARGHSGVACYVFNPES
jgi:hypothetical protein